MTTPDPKTQQQKDRELLENWKKGRVGNVTYKVTTEATGPMYTEKYVEKVLDASARLLEAGYKDLLAAQEREAKREVEGDMKRVFAALAGARIVLDADGPSDDRARRTLNEIKDKYLAASD